MRCCWALSEQRGSIFHRYFYYMVKLLREKISYWTIRSKSTDKTVINIFIKITITDFITFVLLLRK
jgi:hypothetical protein